MIQVSFLLLLVSLNVVPLGLLGDGLEFFGETWSLEQEEYFGCEYWDDSSKFHTTFL